MAETISVSMVAGQVTLIAPATSSVRNTSFNHAYSSSMCDFNKLADGKRGSCIEVGFGFYIMYTG